MTVAVTTPGGVLGELLEVAGNDPLFTIAVIAGLVLTVVVGAILYRWYTRTPGERFISVLRKTDGVTILLHPNPDPDAMAAALGVAYLCDVTGTEFVLQYPGQIRHQENRAFRAVLDLELYRIDAVEDVEYDDVVLVDHSVPRGFDGNENVDPYAVIDHHPKDGTGRTFTDVRDTYGACATILAEYLETLEVEFDDETKIDPVKRVLTTGLLYGILADTNHLTRGCTYQDFAAAAYLFPGVDEDTLDRIANPQVEREVLDVKARAIENVEPNGPFAVVDVGELSNLDAIPQAADELMFLEGVTAVVVIGAKNGSLHLSGRSRDDRVHMGRTLQLAVEPVTSASAGGHQRMGGAQLEIEHMETVGPSEDLTRDRLIDRLYAAMAGDL